MEIKRFGEFSVVVLNDGIIQVCGGKETFKEIEQDINQETLSHEKQNYNPKDIKVVFISLHALNNCNLACKYCFKKEREENEISLENAKKFIRDIALQFSHVDKIVVDPTGSGEPLLQLDKIVAIKQYCNELMDELKIEIVMYLAYENVALGKYKMFGGLLMDGVEALSMFDEVTNIVSTAPNKVDYQSNFEIWQNTYGPEINADSVAFVLNPQYNLRMGIPDSNGRKDHRHAYIHIDVLTKQSSYNNTYEFDYEVYFNLDREIYTSTSGKYVKRKTIQHNGIYTIPKPKPPTTSYC